MDGPVEVLLERPDVGSGVLGPAGVLGAAVAQQELVPAVPSRRSEPFADPPGALGRRPALGPRGVLIFIDADRDGPDLGAPRRLRGGGRRRQDEECEHTDRAPRDHSALRALCRESSPLPGTERLARPTAHPTGDVGAGRTRSPGPHTSHESTKGRKHEKAPGAPALGAAPRRPCGFVFSSFRAFVIPYATPPPVPEVRPRLLLTASRSDRWPAAGRDVESHRVHRLGRFPAHVARVMASILQRRSGPRTGRDIR